jgi:tight adherence protein B
MNLPLLAELISVPVVLGAAFTWLNSKRRQRELIGSRLSRLQPLKAEEQKPLILLKASESSGTEGDNASALTLPGSVALKSLLAEAGLDEHFTSFLLTITLLIVAPLLVATFLDWNILLALLCSPMLALLPIIAVKAKAESRRVKFSEQLPDAIDLMVAVLRSGHSVPQAVKSVALEVPSPCGDEFETVLHRINLGQALPEALINSSKRFRSYELDLMQRAVAIQAEVGGSLAEILEKTNFSLRQRIKLARQLRVITAQSRLSARIVGLLPIVLAVGLNALNPGYFDALLKDKMGQMLLVGAIMLELIGVYTMEKMSTMRI